MAMENKGKISIVGSGEIGQSWATLFVSAGYSVALYDENPEQIQSALQAILNKMRHYESKGLLRGSLDSSAQSSLIQKANSLKECLEGAIYVQECGVDNVEWKMRLFTEMASLASEQTILASSSGSVACSAFAGDNSKCIVAHPASNPYLIRLVEIVPSPATSTDVIARTKALMSHIGQKPIVVKKEIPGLVTTRLECAALMEALRLVQSDAMSVEDVDKIMTYGLACRYPFLGILETAHLNAEGFGSYADRYGETIRKVTSDLGPPVNMDPNGETMQKIHGDLCRLVPLDKLEERRQWREEAIARLVKYKEETAEK